MIWYKLAATAIWWLSLIGYYFNPALGWLVLATTVHLLALHLLDGFAGSSLRDRVRDFLAADLAEFRDQLGAMAKDVEDIKESQVKIAGSFRGRSLPT